MTVDGLRLSPFRALRYAPEQVSSLAAVTSPPYDVVVRPDGLHRLETADPYNIVRLILPQGPDPATRHHRAAQRIRQWRADGVLRRDRQPALYAYEQRTGQLLQRGLIGALRLTPPEDGIVLPHEEVLPEVVDDRAALMHTMAANPEPILLSYRGDSSRAAGVAAVLERAVHRPPLLSTTTEDGVAHRLWAVTEPAELAEVDAELATRGALMADGHHRWATYLRLRAEHAHTGGHPPGPATAAGSATGGGSGGAATQQAAESRGPAGNSPAPADSPWNYGLALLVDTDRYPLRVHAIHRVLPRLPLKQALGALEATGAFRIRTLDGPLEKATAELERTPGNAFLLTNGNGTFQLVDRPAPTLLEHTVDSSRPAAWQRLDATVLHATLLDAVWRVPDTSCDISYLHEARAALAQAAAHDGTAVLLRAVPEGTVRSLAERGVTMPHKSTSFGPKPATGLVLRALEDG